MYIMNVYSNYDYLEQPNKTNSAKFILNKTKMFLTTDICFLNYSAEWLLVSFFESLT